MKRIKWVGLLSVLLSLLAVIAVVAGHRIAMLSLTAATLLALLVLNRGVFFQARINGLLLNENKQLKDAPKWNDEDVQQMEELHRRSELFALQYQINPHFLYNTLDTIRGQALVDDEIDIAEMAEKLARFFRYAISNRETIVRVEEEIHHIEDYISIQKKRFGFRFDTIIEVESQRIYEYYMLKLMLQPLVENAIMHGLERLKKNGLVRISIGATQQKLVICIEDNGVGMSEQKLNALNEQMRSGGIGTQERTRHGNGIAVQNVNARIKMVFGDAYSMHYRSEPNVGTKVTVMLPLVDDYERARYEEIKL